MVATAGCAAKIRSAPRTIAATAGCSRTVRKIRNIVESNSNCPKRARGLQQAAKSKESKMREYPLIVSDIDIYRLRGLLGAGSEELHAELEQAVVMPVGELPRSVVTMGAKVQARDLRTGRIESFQLVYPREADPALHRVSVLAPFGAALLGNAEGETVEWRTPGG